MEKRHARIKELLEECDLTTGNAIIGTLFAFLKIRTGESLFKTCKGLIHSPGGYAYYAISSKVILFFTQHCRVRLIISMLLLRYSLSIKHRILK